MAYRAPRYSYLHAARDVGVSGITLNGGSAHADFPIDNMIDDRAGTRFEYSGSIAAPRIEIDLGTGFASLEIDRIIIPADHNLVDIFVTQDDNSGFSSQETILSTKTATPGTQIDYTFDSGPSKQTERYLRFGINGTAQWYFTQLFFTKIVTFTVGPNIGESPDGKIDNFVRHEQPTGISPTVQLGPQQRVIEYPYAILQGADLTAMELFVDTVGMVFPFWVDPASFSTPPETDEPVLWMKFADMPKPRNTVLVPRSGTRSKASTLNLVESLD